MCEIPRVPAPETTPRWRGLYAILPLAGAALLGVHAWVAPSLARTALDGSVGAGLWLALVGWVHVNRMALEQAAWCACASETLRVRVIGAPRDDARTGVSAPGRRSAHVGVVARDHVDVDHADAAAAHDGDARLDRRPQIRDLRDRPQALRALGARHHGEVDLGPADALAAPAILDRA